jgi:hypothetical protein
MAGGGESADPEPVLDVAAIDMTPEGSPRDAEAAASQPARRRGRPKGSRNRPKPTADKTAPRGPRGQVSEVERLAAKVTDDFQDLVSAWKRQAKEKQSLQAQLDQISKALR